MIKDLKLVDSSIECDAQVCIIGAGTSGIFLARQLRKLGLQVVMLEAGDSVARKSEEIDQHCLQRGMTYNGAESGRSFGLGGTSALWGGQMIPLVPSDFEARLESGFEAWPISYSEVAAYFPFVRQELGLYDESALIDTKTDSILQKKFPLLTGLSDDFDLRLSEWLPFKTRNFSVAFADTLKHDDGLMVWINAVVIGIHRSPSAIDPRIETITAQSSNGRNLLVHPSTVVICAGALESTRLLLEYDEATEGSITHSGAPLGRYFSDHLSMTCGRFVCRDWLRYNMAVAPIFEWGVMRTPRLELTRRVQKHQCLPSAFAHFTFVTHGDTGFDVVRSILRKRQGEQHSLNFSPSLLGRVVSDVSAMTFWRGVYKRLWLPRQADLLLQVDIEQTPNPDSRIYLSDVYDSYKRKRIVIDWKIKEDDLLAIRKVAELSVASWKNSSLSEIADLHNTLPDQLDSFSSLYDVYHPTGSLRMGTSAANSVVDNNLCLWALKNCYASTTVVFPSAGSANPGMTHLALTSRLAEHIAKAFGNSKSLIS